MKKLLLTLLLLVNASWLMAQTTVWCENFDGPTNSMTTSGPGTWALDNTLQSSASNSYLGQYSNAGYAKATSPSFSTLGNTFVVLTFNQICKVDFTDTAKVEISVDGGLTWEALYDRTPVGGLSNCIYSGNSSSFASNDKFSEGAYFAWAPGTGTLPDNTWWKTETFDISALAGNQADVRVRFSVIDITGDGMGAGRNGWSLDDICVTVAACELNQPTITPEAPILQGTLYNLGPFDVFADMVDASQVIFGDVYWTVNGGAPQSFGGMVFLGGTSGNQWAGTISNLGGAFNDGDTVCWWMEATDASCAANVGRYPTNGCVQFIVSSGIKFPYNDNFDVNTTLWTPDITNSTGSNWEIGAPTNPGLLAAQSPPNVWAVGLTADYSNSTESYLLSPVFDFSQVAAANLSFYKNYATEGTWDGVRLEYSKDVGVTWDIVGSVGDPAATNWYTDPSIGSSNLPAWEDVTNGWEISKYKLGTIPGLCPTPGGVMLRFVFTSDGIVTDAGFELDDFSIKIPPGNDVGVSAPVSPLPGSGQASGTSITPTVTVENFGLNIQSNNFNVVYQLNANPVVTTPYVPALGPNSTGNITLPSFTIGNGTNTICYWTDLAGDGDHANDTLCYNLIGVPTVTPTYCDDFEGANAGWVNNNVAGGGTDWELGTPAFGVTSSANSGTNAWDINLNSAYTNNANSELYTPFFDFSTIAAAQLQMYVNYNVENAWDGVRMDFSNDGGVTWNTVGGASDPCGTNWYNDAALNSSLLPAWTGASNGWLKATYRMCCTSGILLNPTVVQFRFVFTSDGTAVRDGFTIDDFCIYNVTGDDVGVTAINTPKGGYPEGTSTPVVVHLENFGSSTLTSFPITYVSTNNGVPTTVTIIWTGSLPPCQGIDVTLPNVTILRGDNDICAWTGLLTDVNHLNDTTCITAVGQPKYTPTYLNSFYDNFDSGNMGWAPITPDANNPATIWELGTPNYGATTGAHSAPNAWDVNLTTSPTTNARTELYSPYFDMTQAQNAQMKFWMNRGMSAFGADQVWIEYAKNNTGVWNKLGTSTTPTATNWYNNADYWDDNTGQWIQCIYKNLPQGIGLPLPSTVQFRFVYTSNTAATDGVSIDDFQLFVPIPLSVTPVSVNVSNPNSLVFPGQPITFAAPILNNGYNGVFLCNATLVIDGQVVSTDPLNFISIGGLQPDSTQVHNFNTTWTAVPGFHTVCVYTDSPNGTTDLDQRDDTVCTTVLVFDSITTNQLPYCTSFESGNQWVTLNALTYANKSDWELGKPNQTYLNNTHSGLKAWSIGLDSNYVNNDSCGLFSALIRVESGKCYKFGFWQQYRFEFGSDGGGVDISKDLGQTWERVDFTGAPGLYSSGFNANYTYSIALDPDDPSKNSFTGIMNNWTKTEEVIRPDIDGQIIIRWRFASDYSARDEGWSIDDFCFEDLGYCSPLGVNEYAANDFGLSQNYPNPTNGLTSIDYIIPSSGNVSLVVTDIIGQVIEVLVSENQAAGKYTANFNANRLAPGMYNYTLIYEGQQITKHMMITQ